MALTWTVNIKWDGTNNVNEASRLQALRVTRGRKAALKSGGGGFEAQGIGEAVLTLDNSDGRFDPFNSSSALYPNVAPGKQVQITVSDGTSYNVMRGHIANIQPIRSSSGAKRTRVTVRDGWQWLRERAVRYAATASVNTGTAVSNLLTAAQYPFSTSVDTGADTIPYWWASNKNAKDEIQSIADSEMALVYCAGDGTLTYKKRSTQWTGASAATWTGAEMTEIDLAMPWDVLRNVIQIRVYPTEIIANGAPGNQNLWRSARTFKIRAGKTQTYNVEYKYEGEKCSAINVLAPAATTDYRAWSNDNGTGDDLTSALTVTLTDKGQDAQIVLTNNGTRAAWVTLLQVRGDVLNKTDALIVESDTSGGSNRRTFLLDVPWQQDVETAQVYADHLANYFDNPRAAPTVRTNTVKAGLARQLAELATVQTINVSTLGVNAAYRIAGAEHDWDAHHPHLIWSQLYFEHKDSTSYFTLNTSTLNGSHVLAY